MLFTISKRFDLEENNKNFIFQNITIRQSFLTFIPAFFHTSRFLSNIQFGLKTYGFYRQKPILNLSSVVCFTILFSFTFGLLMWLKCERNEREDKFKHLLAVIPYSSNKT
jgi:hypothetical protein